MEYDKINNLLLSEDNESEADTNNPKRFPLDASFQGVNRLFVFAFDNTNNGDNKVERDSHRKAFPPKSRYNQVQCIN